MNEYEFDELKQYENYDVDPVSPYALLQRMAAWNKEVRITVTDLENQVESQIAVLQGEINLRVTSEDFNSQIQILDGLISSKVSYTDYNGNTIASLINQTATTIQIQASKINLVGAVSVLSSISGNLGTITAGEIRLDNPDGSRTRVASGGFSVANTSNGLGVYLDRASITFTDSSGFTSIDYRNNGIYTENGAVLYFNGNFNFSSASVTGLNVPYATSAGNADTVDGYHASAFAFAGHSHSYPMQAYLSHQEGTTFEVTSTGLILRTPSGTTKTFTAN